MNDYKIKYFHLSPDDKFMNYVIENCETVAPKMNKYVIRKGNGQLNYVQNDKIVVVKSFDDLLSVFNMCEFNHVIIHYLSKESAKFVNVLPLDIKITWVFWGADGYALPKLSSYKYLESTKMLLSSIHGESYVFNKLKEVFKLYLGAKGKSSQLIKAVKRINRCATWVKGDYDLVSAYNPKLEYTFFNNNSVEQLIEEGTSHGQSSKISNNYVILGNSGTPTNNHIEIMDILKSITALDVVVPLSYGNKKYINEVKRKGESLLGDRFIPLFNFMPKNEYNLMLENAEFIIMNHLRQQAANNIITALWLGTPVLMNNISPLYKTFKSWGIFLGEIHQLEKHEQITITRKQIEANRLILTKYLGRDAIKQGYKELLCLS